MSTRHLPDDLRGLVAQLVREAVREATEAPGAGVVSLNGGANGGTSPAWQPTGPLAGAARTRSETVRITGDHDLQAFVYRLLDAFDNPKLRDDIRTGRLQFTLAGGVAASSAPGLAERVETGAVTERMVARAAKSGSRLVLGPRAVITPLAREKARALGVPIEKEQR